MLEGLQAARAEEIRRGTTLLGPHRDDIRFLSNGLELRLYGSRGQNRTAMLSAKLAQVDWLRSRTGEAPVLLLDEVLAELDGERREDLLSRVAVAPQAVLTSADAAMFPLPFRRQAAVWEVVGGQVLAQPAT
jgi:DNA replication and repair protein RecF